MFGTKAKAPVIHYNPSPAVVAREWTGAPKADMTRQQFTDAARALVRGR